MDQKVYQVKQVLERVGISRNTLYNWEKRGLIPVAKRNISGYRAYTEQEVQDIEQLKNTLFVAAPIGKRGK